MAGEKETLGSGEGHPEIDLVRRNADFDVEADGSSTQPTDQKEQDDKADGDPLSLAQLASVRTSDQNAVAFDGVDDAENPMNWTAKKKWLNIGTISIMTLLT